ncbi:hypothetical protein [Marinobacter zhanjiangensis]|uniref:hypothetical protein n=1 Tax=Marinobacter zhanjiangensis TaxID=578215 RepID=UPI00167A6CFC|nr:hypothetical protein [Marinobacter zhanjiangensis]
MNIENVHCSAFYRVMTNQALAPTRVPEPDPEPDEPCFDPLSIGAIFQSAKANSMDEVTLRQRALALGEASQKGIDHARNPALQHFL